MCETRVRRRAWGEGWWLESEEGEPSWRQTWGRRRLSGASWALEIIDDTGHLNHQFNKHQITVKPDPLPPTHKENEGACCEILKRILGNSE